MRDGGAALGVDLGGSVVKVGAVQDGRLVAMRSFPTLPERGPGRVLAEIARQVRAIEPRSIPIGVSVPGLIDGGVLVQAANLPGWKRVPIARVLGSDVTAPVTVLSDARANGLAERRTGGHGERDLFVFTIGTGVGVCTVIGDLVRAGAGGLLPIEVDAPRGRGQWLEHVVSGPGVVELAHAAGASAAFIDAGQIAEAARRGDSACRQAWERAGLYLGWASVIVTHLLLIDRVVVNGGLAEADDLLLGPARRYFRRNLARPLLKTRDLVRSQLGIGAGALGAALAALEAS